LRPTTARYVVAGQRAPLLTDTIILAERVHVSLVSLSNGSSIFTGCDELGRPLQGHGHAQIFCECNEGTEKGSRGEITHVTVYASNGFGSEDVQALQDLKKIWGADDLEVFFRLQGIGQPEDFGGMNLGTGESPLLTLSRKWVSRTPFVPTRHPKRTRAGVAKLDERGLQIGSPEHDLLRLLEQAGFPRPALVERVAGTRLGGREVLWQEFVCRRSNNGQGRRAAYDRSYGFLIEFAEAVQGPVAVGYGAHFGMGGFEAMKMNNNRWGYDMGQIAGV